MNTDARKKQFKTSKTMVADQDAALRKLDHLAEKAQHTFDGNIITPMEQAVAQLQARIQILENDIVSLDEKIKRLYKQLSQEDKNG